MGYICEKYFSVLQKVTIVHGTTSHVKFRNLQFAICKLRFQLMCYLVESFISGICKIFEEHLKKLNPNSASITYDVQNLFEFIDRLADLSCLVWENALKAYAPHNKDWIKEQIYTLLRRQAAK